MNRLFLLALTLSVVPGAAGVAGSWGKDSLWNDGRAEVAVYDSERIIYGQPRHFKEHLIIVKEDMRMDTLVKADDPKKQPIMRVFKLNQIQKIDTQNYPYNYMTSVFVKDDPIQQVVKMTVGSQEWCGNTFKIYKGSPNNEAGTLMWNSYFDGEADQSTELTLGKDDYFEDQLPLSLRALPLKEGFEKKIRVWDSLTTNRGVPPQVVEVQLKVQAKETIRSRAGSIPCWMVELKKPTGTDLYWFEVKAPHILVKMETSDGRKRLLYGRARWSYWDRRLPRPNVLN
ncbi:MAG: hypothetical protein KCHDKBKB_01178 [Elusimicrobia bacterium]|nr:hypothetical protein [Elusimicrobiota bacterium]